MRRAGCLLFGFLLGLSLQCQRFRPDPAYPETFQKQLYRTERITCSEITKYEEGTERPNCEWIVAYRRKAVETLRPYLGECVDQVRMDNVRFLRKPAVESPPLGAIGSVLPVMRYDYRPGFPYAIPVNAETTLILGVLREDHRPTYQVTYVTEVSIYHESLHCIAHECGAEWWPEAAHGTETDPLAGLDVDGWSREEYLRIRGR